MRLRITREMCGSIDGIRLDDFKVGEVYDVGISMAHYLMGCGFALPVADERPARIVPVTSEETQRSATLSEPSEAADRSKGYVRGDFSRTSPRTPKSKRRA